MKTLSALVLVALAAAAVACHHYNPTARVLADAEAYAARETIEPDECDAMREASVALRTGPERVGPSFGRTLQEQAKILERHAIRCDASVNRGEAMDASARARLRAAFSEHWRTVAELLE